MGRIVVVFLGLALSAVPVVEARSKLLPVDLPELAQGRGDVLSQMRRLGFEVITSDNGTIVFRGSPTGWPTADTVTYIFRDGVSEEIKVAYLDLEGAKKANRVYAQLKRRLSESFGAPWLDRLNRAKAPSKDTRASKTTWENTELHAQIEAKHTPLHAVSVSIKRSSHLLAKREVESIKGDDMPYSASLAYLGLSTSVKEAAEVLFDDFGTLELVRENARTSGQPLKVRLGKVKVPSGIEGVDEMLIRDRFRVLTDGHWNLESSLTAKGSDVEFRVAVIETGSASDKTYAIALDAFTKKSGRAWQKIYSARHRLR